MNDADAAGALIDLVSPTPILQQETETQHAAEEEAVTILRGLASGTVCPETNPPRIALTGEAANANALQRIALSGGQFGYLPWSGVYCILTKRKLVVLKEAEEMALKIKKG